MTNLTYTPSDLVQAEAQQNRYYLYGDCDGLLGNTPSTELWQTNSEYKQGYLDGFARRIDNQINGLDMGKSEVLAA